MTEPSPSPRPMRHRGFSLVEAAIVLVIIGLILGAVLQGRALITNAEYKSFMEQLGSYAGAMRTFRERFNALPGDFADAVARLGVPAGDGNGVIDDGPSCGDSAHESCKAWQHLRAAELIKGDPGDTGPAARPQHPYAGVVSGFFTGSDGNGEFGHKLLAGDLPVEIARRLDDELDDGICDQGRVSGLSGCTGAGNADWPASGTIDVVYAL